MDMHATIQIFKKVDSPEALAAFITAAGAVGEVSNLHAYPVGAAMTGNSSGGFHQTVATGAVNATALADAASPVETTKPAATRARKAKEDAAAPASPLAAQAQTGDAATATPAPALSSAPSTPPADSQAGAASPAAQEVSVEMLRAIAAKAISVATENRAKVHVIIAKYSADKDAPKMSAIPANITAAAYNEFEALLPKEAK